MNLEKVSKVESSHTNSKPSKSSALNKANLTNKTEAKTSSSNSTKAWDSCKKLLSSIGGSKSKSKPSNPAQVKKNETKIPTGLKIVEESNKKIKEKKSENVAGQTSRSKQSNLTKSSKIEPVTVTKKQIQKTTGPKKVETSQVLNDSRVATQKIEINKTEVPKASTVASLKKGTPKTVDPKKDSVIGKQKMENQKTSVSEIPAASGKKIDTINTSNLVQDLKNQPSSSQSRAYSESPIYYIRQDGYETEEFGQKCILCDKDLSCSPNEDDYEQDYDDDDYDYDYYEDYEYEMKAQLLPAVDILPCGHVFHTECSKSLFLEEQFKDSLCVFCLSMD